MRFLPTDEQTGFAASLDELVRRADPVTAARAWAAGESAPGLELWHRLAGQGVQALLVPEEDGGAGGTPSDLVVAFEVLGHRLAVGPWIESAAFLAAALTGDPRRAVARGGVGTVAAPPHTPYALDAGVADLVYAVDGDDLRAATAGAARRSVDATRRLHEVTAGEAVAAGDLARAFDLAALACAAELLGCGERLLEDAVGYARQRRQFGREIGSYQAVKHRLADVRIALDLTRPLVLGAALTTGTSDGPRDVSAAKVAASDAAYLASRVALQVHGAIGYTSELDLGLWINRVRALVGAWGTPSFHRARVLAALVPVLDGGA